ncbi:MAG: 4-hydroxyphenylacetate 3-hydroxylase family protein [Bacillota bacterium]
MPLKTPQQYIDSIKALKRKIYYLGEEITNPTEHPFLRGSLNAVAKSYELAQTPEHEELITANSHLDNCLINRFTHINHSKDDLMKKVKMLRLMGQKTGCCFQRCAGLDAMNSVYSATYEIDAKYSTPYHQRFREFLKYIQENDLVCDAAMTDPKGNMSLSPSDQADQDLYLRIVERREDGIVIRGAKMHQTGALNSHEILVMPTSALKEKDRDYAIICAVPADAEGIIYIVGRQANDARTMETGQGSEIDLGNPNFGGQEALIVFKDVFVPNEKIFMCGETEFAGTLVEIFACYHRQSYGGCKVGVGDTIIGAAATIADYNGTEKANHIKDKLVEMTYLNELMYAGGIAAAAEGYPLASGACWVNPLLANVTKLAVTQHPYEIMRLAQDIAGGVMVTLPSGKDLFHPEIGCYIEKYFKGVNEVPTEDRMKILRYIENLSMGRGAVGYTTESMHGAGSPQAQRIMISRNTNLNAKKQLAKSLAGIEE